MKRNYPLERGAYSHDEQNIISHKLNELYPRHYNRKVFYSSKGVWSSQHLHVHIDTETNTNQYDGLIIYSRDLGCVHLNPYEALFFIESRQLLVYHNEIPLSLAEAYELMLKDVRDLREFTVFTHLNHSGFFCLPHKPQDTSSENSLVKDTPLDNSNQIDKSSDHQSPPKHSSNSNKPLFNLDSINLPYEHVIEQLRRLGPQEQNCTNANPNLRISFDLYKRSTFKQKKPRKDKPGNPDYFLIVCDGATSSPAFGGQVTKSTTSAAEVVDSTSSKSSTGLLFALVEDDSSILFARTNPINSDCLTLPRNYYIQEISQDMQVDTLF